MLKSSQPLINGSFSKKDAKEILSNLFGSKIRYHTLASFSNKERAMNSVNHDKRTEELTNSLNDLLKKIDNSSDDTEIILNCVVNLSLNEVNKNK